MINQPSLRAISCVKGDNLKLATNASIVRMLRTHGDDDEMLVFSDIITKINRVGKSQCRTMILTNKALYNIKQVLEYDHVDLKRRIPWYLVSRITASRASGQFVVHVPTEYDYHYTSLFRDQIIVIIESLYLNATSNKLKNRYINAADLAPQVMTKAKSKELRRNSSAQSASSMASLETPH